MENGLEAADTLEQDKTIHDSYRIDDMRAHIQAMARHWRTVWICVGIRPGAVLIDSGASTGEMKKRYGMIYVDLDDEGRGTYQRYRKDSFYWYKKVIASDGENLE